MIGNLRTMPRGLRGGVLCVLVLASVGMAGASAFARVNCIHRSTPTADLPTPNGGAQQTRAVVFDVDGDDLLLNGGPIFTAAEAADDVSFALEIIDQKPPDRPWFKMAGDLDGNGRPDIIVGGAKGPLVWYAWPDWKKRHIADGGWNGVRGATGDIDADGHIDIVMGGVVWFRNPGRAEGRWTMYTIDKQRMHDVLLVDLDGNGRLDVVGRDQSAFGKSGNAIYLYRQEAPERWTKRVIACPHGEGIQVADLTGSGQPDIVIGGRWYENPGDAFEGQWQEHVYTDRWTHPDAKVDLADISGNGRLDIVLTPAELAGQTYKIAWYEAPSNPRAKWTEHLVVDKIETVIHALALGDFNHDGRVDIAYAEMHQGTDPDEVVIMLNRGAGEAWHKQVFSTRGSHDLLAVDIDGDGNLDLIGANHGGPYQALERYRIVGKR